MLLRMKHAISASNDHQTLRMHESIAHSVGLRPTLWVGLRATADCGALH